MCLTLANAAAVLEHRAGSTALSYTETLHHVGHLGPGDLWRPTAHEPPHVVTSVRGRGATVTVTDQLGHTYRYPADAMVPTAVRDPLVLAAAPLQRSA
jgi:hypothetical protein